MVVSLVATVLDREGYHVVRTSNPAAALELAVGSGGAPDLLLTDVTMPGLNGPLLASAIQITYPSAKVLFMTAHSSGADCEHGIPRDADVLRKPFRIPELVERVKWALESRSAAAAC